MAEAIVQLLDPDQIVLFGSHARGQAGRDSDVDLLVVVEMAQPRHAVACAVRRALRGLGVPKDVLVISPQEADRYRGVPGTVIGRALRDGKLLYVRRHAGR